MQGGSSTQRKEINQSVHPIVECHFNNDLCVNIRCGIKKIRHGASVEIDYSEGEASQKVKQCQCYNTN